MVTLTIDGKTIEVPEGTTVLHAAQQAGIHIPTLCDHPNLSPYGGCRLCLVEVEGMRTLQPSCTMPASNKMVVLTATEKVKAARKFVLTLIFSERNHFCPFCQVSGGDCELQNAAYGEGMTYWPLQPNWQTFEVDASHPYFIIDHNRCILCRRCVRACGELVGNFTLGFEERGASSLLIADFGVPQGESSCISCGTCLQVCPTGAIIDRNSAYRGRETQVEVHQSVCVGCSVGCGINVLTRDNHIVRIEGNWDAAVNGGVLCKTGRFLPVEEKRERIVTPLVRRNGKLTAATWDQALEAITAGLKPLAGQKSDGVAAVISSRLPSETLYTFKQIFADKLGSDMVTSMEEGYPTSGFASLADEMGKSFEGKLGELDLADVILTMGVDLVNNHEVAGFFVKRSVPNGACLIVVDTEANPLDAVANHLVKGKKDSELEVLQGLSAAIVKLGLNKKASAMDADKVLSDAAAKTGVAAETFLAAATTFASAKRPVLVTGKKLVGAGAAITKALLELAQLAGVLNEDRSGLISVKGHANSVAASLYQLDKPFKLNGHKAAYIALGDEDPTQRLIQRLKEVPFLVVQASYVSPLSAMASVVLPAAAWAEQEGHYVNLDGHVQMAVKSLNAPEEVQSNTAVLEAVAACLNAPVALDGWKDALHTRIPVVALEES